MANTETVHPDNTAMCEDRLPVQDRRLPAEGQAVQVRCVGPNGPREQDMVVRAAAVDCIRLQPGWGTFVRDLGPEASVTIGWRDDDAVHYLDATVDWATAASVSIRPQTMIERRSVARRPQYLRAKWQRIGADPSARQSSGVVADLSEVGARMIVDERVSEGTDLIVLVTLAGGALLRVTATVVRRPEPGAPGTWALGLGFGRLAPDERATIQAQLAA